MRGRATVALSIVAALAGVVVATMQTTPAAGHPVLTIARAHADYLPTVAGDDAVFILLLGSDARPGTATERGLCDSIHILGIDRAGRRATLVGIPRDSYVALSTGGMGKINSAMPRGGPEAMVETVENLTGVTFDYYALTSFGGLTNAVNALGGITVEMPYSFTGFEQTSFTEGPQTLDGAQALEYTRERKALSHGDFDRSMNQGRLLFAALGQFRREFEEDPTALFRWIGTGMRNITTDVPLEELLRLAFTASQIPAKRVTNLVAVGTIGTAGTTSIVDLPDPHPMFEDIARDGYVLQRDIPPDAQPAG